MNIGRKMKTTLFLLGCFGVWNLAAAEACTVKTEVVNGKPHTFETCDAIIEEVFRHDDDGFIQTAYAVQWNGSRVIVEDTLSRSNHAAGDHVSFLVVRTDIPERSIRALAFLILEPPPEAAADCP
jgi:hypothetical protein